MSSFDENLARLFYVRNPKVQRILFGVRSVEKVGEEARRLEGKNACIISDESLEKLGLLDKVMNPLRKEGLNIEIFNEVRAEPTTESVRGAANFVRQGKYDVVIGVGGGSCLDTTKLVAGLARNSGDILEYLSLPSSPPAKRFEKKAQPMILIPTTSGTGSEVDSGALVIEKGRKAIAGGDNLFADVALVDPAMTLTLPPMLTAGCGMDALSHLMEGLLSRQVFPPSDALAMEGVRLVSRSLRKAYFNGEDLQARWDMSLAAMLGGWVMCYPWFGGFLGHCVAEIVGPKYKIPHGIACAVALPYWMEFNLPASLERLALIASALGEKVQGLSLREAAAKSVDATVRLVEDIELPTCLKELSVPKEDLPKIAEYIVKESQYWPLYDIPTFNPRKLTAKNITDFLIRMWEGRILQ